MKLSVYFIFFCLIITIATGAYAQPLKIWYRSPAAIWEACIPLGNGRLGAMPDGGIFHETIVLNDITLWSGGKQNADRPDAGDHLKDIQQLLLNGKNTEAQRLMGKYFVSTGAGSGNGDGANVPYGSYQILGNLRIAYHYGTDSADTRVNNYHRELLLDKAVSTTSYALNGVEYRREYLTSFDNDLIVIKLTSNKKGKLSCDFSLDRPENAQVLANGNELEISGQLPDGTGKGGMKYSAILQIRTEDGKVTQADKVVPARSDIRADLFIGWY